MLHRTTIAALLAGALLGTAGCSLSVTSAGPPSEPTVASPASAAPASPSATESTASVDLDRLVQSATRPADRGPAKVLGDKTGAEYPNALSLWAGCDGDVDQVTYKVDGYRLLEGRLALRDSAPRDVVIEVLISVDGSPVQNIQLDGVNPTPAFVPVQAVLTGRSLVTTQTKVVKGTCTESEESYALMVDGRVS